LASKERLNAVFQLFSHYSNLERINGSDGVRTAKIADYSDVDSFTGRKGVRVLCINWGLILIKTAKRERKRRIFSQTKPDA